MKALVILKTKSLDESDLVYALKVSNIPDDIEKVANNVFNFDLAKSSNHFANLLNFLNDRNVAYHLIYLLTDYVEFSTSQPSSDVWAKL